MSVDIERQVTHGERVIALREAIDQVNGAANMLRGATLGLVDVDCNGAVDVASRALYEVHKASDILEAQYKDLLAIEAER